MRSVVDKSRDVVLGHFRELFLKNTFQSGENNKTVSRTIIVDYSKLDVLSALF